MRSLSTIDDQNPFCPVLNFLKSCKRINFLRYFLEKRTNNKTKLRLFTTAVNDQEKTKYILV